MRNKSYVLDTSVIIEYIDEESPYRGDVEKLFKYIISRGVEAYIPSVTLSEVLYVATRIYKEARSKFPNRDAENFVLWLWKHPYINIVDVTPEISLEAGEIRKSIKISLIDCYVLATAKNMGIPPLFLKLEKEMEKYIEKLKEYRIEFLIPSNSL